MYLILVSIIIAILLLIYFWWSFRSRYITEDNTNYVWGKVQPRQNSADGKIIYLGYADFPSECAAKCRQTLGCKANTWHSSKFGEFANSCYGMAKPEQRVEEQGVFSGMYL